MNKKTVAYLVIAVLGIVASLWLWGFHCNNFINISSKPKKE
jgi:hypothetical protein